MKGETYIDIQHSLLELFAKKATRKDYLDEVVKLLCDWSGCRCGGVRVLDEYGNIPYESYLGFSPEFWNSENHLTLSKDQCACVRVFTEKFESQDRSFLTPWGSFYCNNTFRLAESLTEEELARFRGTCVQNGFASVAVLPIRYGEKIVGAIHLADDEGEKVPRFAVEFMESLTPLIGGAIHRFNLEEELKRDDETQKVINTLMGFSLENIAMEELLRRGLELILSIPWLALESRGAVFLRENSHLVLKADVGLPESTRRACTRVPIGCCLCGQAAQNRELIFVEYPGKEHGRIAQDVKPHGHYCLPLESAEGVLGLITLYLSESYRDDDRKREFLKTIARLLGSSIEHKRAEQMMQESEKKLRSLSVQLLDAQEKERKRVSHELHDSIGQVLASIKFGMENVIQQIDQTSGQPARKTLETSIGLIKNAMEEVRRISVDLRPSILDDLGILATLSWFFREFETIYSGIRIEKRMDLREEDVPEALKIVIYRVLQEALNNVAKHSGTDRVGISLRRTGAAIELAIEDHGAGFDLMSTHAGLGLGSMRERVEITGGNFSLESSVGKGTVISARWIL